MKRANDSEPRLEITSCVPVLSDQRFLTPAVSYPGSSSSLDRAGPCQPLGNGTRQILSHECRSAAQVSYHPPPTESSHLRIRRSRLRWTADVGPILELCMVALNDAEQTVAHRPDSILSIGDRFRSVSKQLVDWSTDHACPVKDIDFMLIRAARSYAGAADLLTNEAMDPQGPSRLLIGRELDGLRSAMVRLVTAIRE